jgi:Flp pilus assembly protein CpaB
MERRRVIMLGLTLAIATWLMADLLLPMTGWLHDDSADGILVGIAVHDMPAGYRVKVEDVEPIPPAADAKPDANGKTAEAKPRIPAAVGRTLARAVAAGGEIRDNMLVKRSPGEIIARQLPPGYRAITVTLHEGLSTIALYPGAMVDVLSTTDLPAGPGTQREAMTRTVIERARVLAVNEEVVGTVRPAAGADERRAPVKKQTVTLAVTPEQAAQVEFASTKGTLGVTLRAEEDLAVGGNAAAHRTGLGPPPATTSAPPAASQATTVRGQPNSWEVTVVRGKETERVTFPVAPEATDKPK